ncbi:hypothetical protein ACFL0W_03185 [Nanoarchaeota archaeon]
MKNKIISMILSLLILAVLITGCGQDTTQAPSTPTETADTAPEAETEPAKTPSQPEETVVEAPAQIPELPATSIAKIERDLKAEKLVLVPNFVRTKVGEYAVIGFGLSNKLMEEKEFLVSLRLQKARDPSQSSIITDEKYLNKWFEENDFLNTKIKLAPKESVVKTLVVKIGDEVQVGMPTPAGTYYFSLITEYDRDGFTEDYEVTKTVSVKVEE